MMLINLSHEFKENTTLFPGTDKPSIEQICTVREDEYSVFRLTYSNHIGTHLDVQGHMIENGKLITDYHISNFRGKGVVVDCRSEKVINKDLLIDKIEDVEFVLICSGFDKLYEDSKYFSNYPLFTEEAIDYLIEKGIKGVGVDYISVDPIDSTDFKLHKKILGEDIIIYENLCNLDQLVGKDFNFLGFPLLYKGDGIPVRVVAEIL
ncbi:cyclase family protein [Mycoplasmatota bacterium]|nr:cyclase family protein [Mycoplasmatota bacterium]